MQGARRVTAAPAVLPLLQRLAGREVGDCRTRNSDTNNAISARSIHICLVPVDQVIRLMRQTHMLGFHASGASVGWRVNGSIWWNHGRRRMSSKEPRCDGANAHVLRKSSINSGFLDCLVKRVDLCKQPFHISRHRFLYLPIAQQRLIQPRLVVGKVVVCRTISFQGSKRRHALRPDVVVGRQADNRSLLLDLLCRAISCRN